MADKVQQAATTLFRKNGFYTIKTQDALQWNGGGNGPIKVPEEPGKADMAVLTRNRSIFVEVKTIQNGTWSSDQWRDNQRDWCGLMKKSFDLDTYLLLVCTGNNFSMPHVTVNWLTASEDHVENTYDLRKPKMAWLVPASPFQDWLDGFLLKHGIGTVPYHKVMGGRTTLKEPECHDNLLEALGNWALDFEQDHLAFNANLALKWESGYFQIPNDHIFRKHFE